VVGFSPAFVCLSVCFKCFQHNISKTDAARMTKLDVEMTKLDVEMVYHDSWKYIYFGVKR